MLKAVFEFLVVVCRPVYVWFESFAWCFNYKTKLINLCFVCLFLTMYPDAAILVTYMIKPIAGRSEVMLDNLGTNITLTEALVDSRPG